MATKSAGRVSIRVLPDSTGFRRDLKTSLERIEQTVHAEIPAKLVVTRESIRELKEQLRELSARIKVDPYVTEEQLHDLKKRIEGVDPHLKANLDSLNARRQLATLSRSRFVTLFVRVNKASAAAAAQTLAALSGARLLGNIFDDFFNGIKNLDKNAPKLGLISSGILALSGSVAALISNLATLGVSFANLGQISVLLPALFSGAAISVGVLIAAFKDMKKVLGDLAPGFHTLQDTISSKFWHEAAQPIRELVNHLFPLLNQQLGEVARAWGNLFGTLARELQADLTPDKLATMMGNLTKAIDIASKAMKPLVSAFSKLGLFGSEYLPRLSEFIVKISDQFDKFVTKASNDGRLTKWAEQGITAFKDLGRVFAGLGRVFAALGRAAEMAGGSSFAGLADGLNKLAKVMNESNFQVTFSTIFGGAHKLMDGLVDGLDRLGGGLSNFAPTLARVFDDVGKTIGALGDNIAKLISNKTLQDGIETFFSSFLSFMDQLKPAMDPLGEIFGTLAKLAGNLLAVMGPLITDVLKILAPIFEEMSKQLGPLIPLLSSLLGDVLQELGPVLITFVKEILPPLVPIIKALAPLIVAVVKAASPVLVAFFQKLGDALEFAAPYIEDVARFITDLVNAFNKLPLAFFQLNMNDKKGFLGSIAAFVQENPGIIDFFKGLVIVLTSFGGVFAIFGAAVNFINFINSLNDANQKISAIMTTIGLLFGLGPQWTTFWSGLPIPVQIAVSLVTGSLSSNIPLWIAQFVGFFMQSNANWSIFWIGLGARALAGMGGLGINISQGFPGLLLQFSIGLAGLLNQWNIGFRNIGFTIPGWFTSFVGGVAIGVSTVVAKIGSLGAQGVAVLNSWTKSFENSGASLIAAFARGITSGTNPVVAAITAVVAEVSKYLPHSPAKKGPFSGRGYTTFSGAALVRDFGKGMASEADALQRTSSRVLGNVASTANGLSLTSAASGATGSTSSAPLINIEGDYYGATPEKVADELDKKQRRANLVNQIGKVGK